MNTLNEMERHMAFGNLFQNHYGPVTGYRISIRPSSEFAGPLDL